MNLAEINELMKQRLVLKRDGNAVPFTADKIRAAITVAFLKNEKGEPWTSGKTALSQAEHETVDGLTVQVCAALSRKNDATLHIEDIQDQVELALMRSGEHDVARAYVLYREKQKQKRQPAVVAPEGIPEILLNTGVPLDYAFVKRLVDLACVGLPSADADAVVREAYKNVYNGVPMAEVLKSLLLASRTMMEKDPDYDKVTARLLLHTVRTEVFGLEVTQDEAQQAYEKAFALLIHKGIAAGRIAPFMAEFDLDRLAKALVAERDLQYGYIGLQTLYDRYFLHHDGVRFELPQSFLMRVAMGLASKEVHREERAIEFYNLLSSFDFMSSTPTLFNSGTPRPQLSSCFLTTVSDDLEGIYDSIKDNALLAKFSGGLGNDWTPVRALGSHIRGTNGNSQGVVPFLKVVNDTAVAVNQGGKRAGAVCSYLETWHLDIEEFLDLRKNTGDDRRRTHDMNTANWIPDLFMKRVMEKGEWTLFTPSEVPDLHDLYGRKFEAAYEAYEAKAERGEIRLFKKVQALDLWRKMLSMIFETGHPWITFKDPCNIRSPQQHAGVVHSSNLCTEITLNTSSDEIAVCNLGSVNLPAHIKDGRLDLVKLRKTVSTAMRMLDNVIDINYYGVDKARNSNMRHRPVALGMMGFHEFLYALRVPYASEEAVRLADETAEAVCYYAYLASTELAEERGRYESYAGSLWDLGILPIDSIAMLANQRDEGHLQLDTKSYGGMDWELVRARIRWHGMRNSNCVAIAPTATISNIVGVSASIDPTYQQLYVKSNMSGEFTDINAYLVRDLKERGLWDEVMVSDLKYFDGSLAKIERVPADLKLLYATAFEIEPHWLIEAAARRQKWIDQAQSLNIYMAGASGKKLDETYKLAWLRGLKTTYYLRTIGATHSEKSTSRPGTLNAVAPAIATPVAEEAAGPVCTLRPGDDGFSACDACQ
ncbi:ribonucleoside-diphosphate reductase subunit alpha [Noviherbaspirillum sp. DKR-6]|uniref:Ribonucleoside-diphosphate reductase n=2 Tax=Noviherbaspirillum pedocola TaxID=2801341 RepID=A0A934SUL8_9BURK|nr:ribonucleoside-diphosphate reductase subunit alpha [Noviherbaspirillum pedocola]